jgi:hypothetical protein
VVLLKGLGAQENVSVLVIRLNTDRGPSLARLRPNRQVMSVDDVEAAAAHEAAKQARAAATSPIRSAAVNRRPSFPRTPATVSLAAPTAKPRHQTPSDNTPLALQHTPSALTDNSKRFQHSGREEQNPNPSDDSSSVTSSDQVMRMTFSTSGELDDDDDHTLTNSSGASDDQGLDKTGRFVRDVISVEHAPVASGFTSSTSRHNTATTRIVETTNGTSGANKRPLPVAPKPRFAKKNTSGVNNESISRNGTSANGDGYTTSGDNVGVARMVFNDSEDSVEDSERDFAMNRYQQRTATPYGDRRKLHGVHRITISGSPPPQRNVLPPRKTHASQSGKQQTTLARQN